MYRVSVYVPCYNAKKTIDKCLQAILKQTYPVDEILVVNDGSDDGSAEIISKFPVKIINNENNKGLAAARNIALQEARNNFVASVDADCIVDSNWLEECMKNFNNPNVVAVGGRLVETYNNNIADSWRQVHLKHHWGENRLTDPIFLSGSNLVVRKDAIKQVGFYDEKKYRNNYEDVDLSLRLKERSFKLIYEPKAKVMHMRRDTIVSVLKSFWQWKYPDYKQKYIMRPVFNLVNSIKLISEDMANKNHRLIFMDILAFIFCTYFDFKEFFKKLI
ncbi:MAG: glycosyltransferase [Candidatus Omnitrophota bacterium]|nr:glycosyltransferase [Candidatus Omnitrophota bacterium]